MKYIIVQIAVVSFLLDDLADIYFILDILVRHGACVLNCSLPTLASIPSTASTDSSCYTYWFSIVGRHHCDAVNLWIVPDAALFVD